MSIHNNASITRKRNRDEAEEVSKLDQRPFVIKDPSDPFSRPRTFTPLCVLSRGQLPLAYLDTATSGTRILTSHIPVLEACYECENDASVLIAKETNVQRLYAIERVERRCYALCRLGEWVAEAELRERSQVVLQHGEINPKRRALENSEGGAPWWKAAAVDVDPPSKDETTPHLNLPTVAMRRVMDAPQKVTKSAAISTDPPTTSAVVRASPGPPEAPPEQHVIPQDILKELAKQYLDALYLSRTSLAYFTKGPLSRARVAFATEAGNDIQDLIQFLRDCVLTSSTMDKKYKDSIAVIVKKLSSLASNSPEKTSMKPTRQKRRKWKLKRDKDGFFTDEHEYVEQWWQSTDDNEPITSTSEQLDEDIRRRSTKIRNRETFLQIVIVLEVLALEVTNPVSTRPTTLAANAQDLDSQQPETQGELEPKKTKPKKKQDLPALLETLLDKLCIWQSLQSNSPVKNRGAPENNSSDTQNDELHSFCIEVVVPFYSSRIPHHANLVNKKLGGPTAPTSIKTKSSSGRKPGEPAMRQPPEKKTRQPLARVSTDILNQSSDFKSKRPPSLQRSATDSETALHIKREGSEVPMSAIPPAPQGPLPKLAHSRRASLFTRETPQLKAFSKREVDLTAISASNEAKMRKKKDVEAKLKEAVEMLKKPNRAMAVKEVEERTDLTFAKALAKGSRALGGKRDVSARDDGGGRRGVHVASTPRHARTVRATPHKPSATAISRPHNAASASTRYLTAQTFRSDEDRAFAIPTSTPAIPQTGHRPRIAQTVQETPSRGFAKFMPAGLVRMPGTLESPVSSRLQAMVHSTPSKGSQIRGGGGFVAASPDIARKKAVLVDAEGADDNEARNDDGGSVYDKLGWDDVGYEELT